MFYKWTDRIHGKGIGLQGLSSGLLDKLIVPLPPYAEQLRIDAKIEELFAVLDSINESLYTWGLERCVKLEGGMLMAAIIVVILGVLMVVFTIKHLFYGGSRFNHSTSVEQQNKAKSQKKKNKPVKKQTPQA